MQLEKQQKEKDENFNGVIIMPSDMPYECVKSIIRYVLIYIYIYIRCFNILNMSFRNGKVIIHLVFLHLQPLMF